MLTLVLLPSLLPPGKLRLWLLQEKSKDDRDVNEGEREKERRREKGTLQVLLGVPTAWLEGTHGVCGVVKALGVCRGLDLFSYEYDVGVHIGV